MSFNIRIHWDITGGMWFEGGVVTAKRELLYSLELLNDYFIKQFICQFRVETF